MLNILAQHAVEKIWCEPRHDKQFTIGLARLTPVSGASRVYQLHRRILQLPNYNSGSREYYHLYQVGSIPSSVLSIVVPVGTWVDLATVAASDSTVIDLFIDTGLKIPLNLAFATVTPDGNLLVAVTIDSKWASITTRPLLMRLYSNLLFDTEEWRNTTVDANAGIAYSYATLQSSTDYISFLAAVNQIANKYGSEGRGLFYTDGLLTNMPVIYTDSMRGSTVGFYWDTSIVSIEAIPLSTMRVFSSHIDPGVAKYGVVRDTGLTFIDYHDDVDFYVTNSASLTVYKGVYLGRQRPNGVRQLTHSAYSLNKSDVDRLASLNHLDGLNCSILMVVRNGGARRGLVTDHYRLDALYRLPHIEVIKAITDLEYNQTVPEWHMVTLESSAYNRLIGSEIESITNMVTEDAYGYNAASMLLAPNALPVSVFGAARYVTLPRALCVVDRATTLGRRTFYAYSAGLFLGWFNNTATTETVSIPGGLATADTVEVFNYRTDSVANGNVYGELVVASNDLAQHGYRCYVCSMNGGIPNEDWVDVTDTDFYSYDREGTPTITWNAAYLAIGNMYTCVRIGGVVTVSAEQYVVSDTGCIEYVLNETTEWLGSTVTKPLLLQPGVMDIFLDGYSLVRDVDYYVEWPKIVICKRSVDIDTPAAILIRYYGWCDPASMEIDKPRESGFVKEGILSINCRLEIRSDRNSRIVSGGLLRRRDQVRFIEDAGGDLNIDGRPYGVSDYAIAVENFTSKHTVPYRAVSLDLDDRVMAYLDALLDTPDATSPTILDAKWGLYSPFCSRVINALKSGDIDSVPLASAYTDTDARSWVSAYTYLLAYDPAVLNNNTSYINVFPHPYPYLIGLTNPQYTFVETIIRLFLNNRVDLTQSVTIGI